MVLVMADDSKKKNNPFAKVIGDLRVSRNNLIEKQQVEAGQKAALDAKEYQDWLKKAEEILVEDCVEAIDTITVEQLVNDNDGSITFTSEAFIWFRDNRNTTLFRIKRLSELSQMERKQIILDNRIPQRISQNERENAIKRNISSYTWGDQKLREVFERISNQLGVENLGLKTKDGVEFVLHWNSKSF